MYASKVLGHLFKPKQMNAIWRIAPRRTLFDDRALGLTAYRQNRIDAHNNVEQSDRFRWEMKAYILNVKPLELSNLKSAVEILLHLIESNADDMDLLRKSLLAFQTMPNVPRAVKRTLGNMAMKALHVLEDKDAATMFITDPELQDFFSGFMAMFLYYDMQYKNGQYDTIASMDMQQFQDMQLMSASSSRFIDALYIGSCYKLNTPESCDKATSAWPIFERNKPFSRTVTLMAALLLKQDKPEAAATLALSFPIDPLTQQIRLKAMAQLGQFAQVNKVLWSIHRTPESVPTVSSDVMEMLNTSIESLATSDDKAEFQKLRELLLADDRISTEAIDDLIEQPVSYSWRTTSKKKQILKDLQ